MKEQFAPVQLYPADSKIFNLKYEKKVLISDEDLLTESVQPQVSEPLYSSIKSCLILILN